MALHFFFSFSILHQNRLDRVVFPSLNGFLEDNLLLVKSKDQSLVFSNEFSRRQDIGAANRVLRRSQSVHTQNI